MAVNPKVLENSCFIAKVNPLSSSRKAPPCNPEMYSIKCTSLNVFYKFCLRNSYHQGLANVVVIILLVVLGTHHTFKVA